MQWKKHATVLNWSINLCLFWLAQELLLKHGSLDEFLFFCCLQAPSFCFCNEDITIYDITLISMATDCKANNILHLHCRTSREEIAPIETRACEITPAVSAGNAWERDCFVDGLSQMLLNRFLKVVPSTKGSLKLHRFRLNRKSSVLPRWEGGSGSARPCAPWGASSCPTFCLHQLL